MPLLSQFDRARHEWTCSCPDEVAANAVQQVAEDMCKTLKAAAGVKSVELLKSSCDEGSYVVKVCVTVSGNHSVSDLKELFVNRLPGLRHDAATYMVAEARGRAARAPKAVQECYHCGKPTTSRILKEALLMAAKVSKVTGKYGRLPRRNDPCCKNCRSALSKLKKAAESSDMSGCEDSD